MRADLTTAAGAGLALDLGPGRLGNHLLLASGLLLLVVATIGSLRLAWVRRAQQQEEDLPDLPTPPEHTGSVLAAPLRGMYLGTVDAGHWLEWMAARGPGGRASGYITVYEGGVQVDRAGTAFWIPREAVRGARLERAHAGKVAASPGRLVVIAWSFGEHELETGFRGEDRSRQPKIVRAVHELIGPGLASPADGEVTRPRPVPRGRLRLRGRAEDGRDPAAPRDPAASEWEEPYGALPAPVSPAAYGPNTTPIPKGNRPARPARRTPVPPGPARPPTAAPRGTGPHAGAARPTGPQAGAARPTGTQAGGPRATGPQAGGPRADPGGPGEVDPLTSPLGDVVRRMREER